MDLRHFSTNSQYQVDNIVLYATGVGYINQSTGQLNTTITHNAGLILPVVFYSFDNGNTWVYACFSTDQNAGDFSASNNSVYIWMNYEGAGTTTVLFRVYGYPVDNNNYQPTSAISKFSYNSNYGADFITNQGTYSLVYRSSWTTITSYDTQYLPMVRLWTRNGNTISPVYFATLSDGTAGYRAGYEGFRLYNGNLQYINTTGVLTNKTLYYKIYGGQQ